ncbi:MAG: hypothetical protein CVV11_19940 [Gammaproteobacteria bacterium HGW-Gammaproteobacteria-15]|nr:MAG: hypothetical protein CVV11_19940 [Gammaproteobacteria bacterium HGW-Gammaproteobacteria-15]
MTFILKCPLYCPALIKRGFYLSAVASTLPLAAPSGVPYTPGQIGPSGRHHANQRTLTGTTRFRAYHTAWLQASPHSAGNCIN